MKKLGGQFQSKIVSDAGSDYLRRKLAACGTAEEPRPVYTYPRNGLRKLVDKPLVRPVSR